MDRTYRVDDHRIQAEELDGQLTAIVAWLESIQGALVGIRSVSQDNRQDISKRHLRVIARLDALTTLVEELAWRPEPRKKRWWWS
jgi:molybdopterin biosynthesis enzyme MoaB